MPTLKRIRARINKKHFGEVEIFWDGLEIFWLIDIFLVGGGARIFWEEFVFLKRGQDFFRVVEIVPEEYKYLGGGGLKFF